MSFSIGISPSGRRLQKTEKSWSVHVHNRKPLIDENEVVSIKFLGETTNKQAKWCVVMASGQTRTVWTEIVESGGC